MNETIFVLPLEFKVAQVCRIVYTYIFLTFGLTGNLISAVVYLRPVFRSTAMGVYLATISIQSEILLVTNWIVAYPIFKFPQTEFHCRFTSALNNSLFNSIAFLVITISTDRFLLVFYPHRFLIIKKLKFQISVILIVFSTAVLLNIPLILKTQLGEYGCMWIKENGFHYLIPFMAKDLVFNLLIPIVSNLAITIVFIRKLNESSSKSKKITSNSKFTIGSLVNAVFFMISNFPILTSSIIGIVLVIKFDEVSYEVLQIVNVFEQVSKLLCVTYYSFSIVLNFTFNSIFRKELLYLIKKPFK